MVNINADLLPFSDMVLSECREKTFVDWPYRRGKCTAKKLAKAGFYVVKEGETAATCYFCFKELEGWEKDDDPFEEHKKHAPYCPFINMFSKPPESLSFSQVLQLERGRMKRKYELQTDRINENIQLAVNAIVNSNNSSAVKRGNRGKK